MTEQAPPPSDKLDALKEKIPKAAQYYWRLHIRHSRFNNAMVTLSIILGAAAPFVGQAGHGLEAGIMASVIGAIVALQKHFRWAQRSDLYRLLHVEAKNLRDRLNFKVRTVAEFEAIVDALAALRRHAASKLPEGGAPEVAKEIYTELPDKIRNPNDA
jgi:hypothetical protein